MRYFIPLLAMCSGFAVAITSFSDLTPVASAAQVKTDARVAAVSGEAKVASAPKTHITCSRNRPLQVSADGTKIASSDIPEGLGLASNIVKLFCRDVRINTIVVRDYCAVVRE